MLIRIAAVIAALATLQPAAGADVAARMSGRWTLNESLTGPEPGRGGRRGGGAPLYALAAGAPQRGNRGGASGSGEPPPQMPDVTPAEAAGQRALSAVQQVPRELTIEATATQIKILEARGDSVFQIDGRNTVVDVPGGSIKVKSRWDRGGLRQEFASTMRVLHRFWSVDATGRLLTLKQRLEGVGLKGAETQTVFDRQ